jgi:hypothetical protein
MNDTVIPNTGGSNILDTIMGSQTQSILSSFDPVKLVSEILSDLKERDREIVVKRFGLDGFEMETLEAIGQKFNLTRERVRQIEKDSMSQLMQKQGSAFKQAHNLIFETVLEHGNVMSEEMIIETVLVGRTTERDRAAVKFLLSLSDQLKNYKETTDLKSSWSILGFDHKRLSDALSEFINILSRHGKVMAQQEFFDAFRQTEYFKALSVELNEKALKSYLDISKVIQVNPFMEMGLRDWVEVRPRDVGDKAYLVLKHNGKPEHYSDITKLINERKFDERIAYQETVHNELIKDQRFVLIGRGIYALSEWGYKKGVVADVIKEVLALSGKPLTREEIIEEVLKKRFVKRNTILVGLSNKKFFQKVGKDKYTIAA